MINAIITGHGEFSLGMLHALEMIAGEQDKFKAVPFLNDDSMEGYQEKLLSALKEVSEESSSTIIFTDLKGGTPFNVSMLLTTNMPNVKVVAGSNLPILLEFVGQRFLDGDIEQVLEALINTATEGIVVGNINIDETENEEEDGI